MDNGQKLLLFFQAENARDWISYEAFLHSEIQWELHSTKTERVCGKEVYLERIKRAYGKSDSVFQWERMDISAGGERIVTVLKNEAGEQSCDIFEFRDGLIYREYEFLLG